MRFRISPNSITTWLCVPVLFLLLQIDKAYAHEVKFENLSTEQGLSQASVTSIVQDQTGFLWFGTYDGLNRYDGYAFKVFKVDPKDSKSLQNNFIRTLLVDRTGRLWVGTSGGGLSLFDRKTETFVNYLHDEGNNSSISFDDLYTIFEDRSGAIWVGTWGGGLNKLVLHFDNQKDEKIDLPDSVSFMRFRHDPDDINSLASDKMTSIYQDREGMLWIGTRAGISILDPDNQKFIRHYHHEPANSGSLSSDNITHICEDKKGNIWIGTWGGGLNRFNPETERFDRFSYDPDNPESISHNIVMRLFTDKNGDLWIGTWGGGLNRISAAEVSVPKNTIKFRRFQHHDELESGGGYSVYDIFQDQTGVLWIGTDWTGIKKLDPDKNQFALFEYDIQTPNHLNSNTVLSLYKDRQGLLWIGTLSGGLNRYNEKTEQFRYFMSKPSDPSSLSNNTVRSICEDRSGRLWIGTEAGLNQFNRKTGVFTRCYQDPDKFISDNIITIYQSSDEKLWLSKRGLGLFQYDTERNLYKSGHDLPAGLSEIKDQIIWCITEDLYNRLWIATSRSGLYRYDRSMRQLDHFMHDEDDSSSLTDNLVYSLYVSAEGDIWVATSRGLDQIVNPINIHQPLKIKHYTTDNGLYTNTVQSILEDDHGNLWVCNGDYLVCVNPKTGDTRGYNANDRLQIGEFSINAAFKDLKTGEMYIGGKDGFTLFHPDSIKDNSYIPRVVVTSFQIFKHEVQPGQEINGRIILDRSIIQTKSIRLSYKDNVLSFGFAALHFNSPENNLYAYKLEGFEKEWNYSGRIREATYTNLDPGHYEFKVKASNSDGKWNKSGASISLIVTPPFWETLSFRIVLFLIVVLGLYIIYRIRIYQIELNQQELETQVKERTESLKHITEELKKSNKELEQFAYVASHDLQEPLRMVSAYAGLLEKRIDKKLDKDSREFLSYMKDGALRMQVLINDLLDYSRISTKGKSFQTADLNTLMQHVLQNLKISIDEKQARVTFDKLPTLNVDESQIVRLFQNLIGNAIKYCHLIPEVHVAVSRNNGEWTFTVSDNGIGINPKYQTRIFGIFQRLHGRDEYSGTGIGLAVCKKIVERHGGKLWVESEAEKGSVFYFTLPQKKN